MTNSVLGLRVTVDRVPHDILTNDDLEDVQVLLLTKSQRSGDRGEDFDRDFYAYQASAIEYQYHAIKQGLLLPASEI